MHKVNKNIFILVVLILVGALHVYPDLKFIFRQGDSFKGVPYLAGNDETVYLSKLSAVIYRGDLRLTNPGTYEHQGGPMFLPSLAEIIEGLLGRSLSLAPWQTDILATFLFPAIICLLLYFLSLQLSGSFKFSLLSALAAMLAYYWLTSNIGAIFSLSTDYLNPALIFSRPISPQFHFIPFLITLYLIYRSIFKDSSYFIAILAGIFSGLLFYTSLYYWTFVFSGLALMFVIDCSRGKRERFKRYLLIALTALVISIPFWASYLMVNQLPYFDEIFKRMGGIYTHAADIPLIETGFLLFLIFMRFFVPGEKEQLYYMISFVGGGLICLNQQVITGKTIQPEHWRLLNNKIFIILSIFVCASFLFRLIEKSGFYRMLLKLLKSAPAFFFLCLSFFFLGLTQQNFNYANRSPLSARLQEIGGALKYIHNELPDDAVILTDPFREKEEQLISSLTKNYPYLSGSFFLTSTMRDAEIKERYFAALHFYDYSPEEANGLFKVMNGGLFRGMAVHPSCGGSREGNEAYTANLKDEYASFVKLEPLVALNKYKADYVLLNNTNRSRLISGKQIAAALMLSYDDGSYSIYKITGR